MLANIKDGPVLAFALAAIGVVGIVVAVCTGHTVPTELWALETAVVGGALGITNATPSSSSSSSSAPADPVDQAGGATGP